MNWRGMTTQAKNYNELEKHSSTAIYDVLYIARSVVIECIWKAISNNILPDIQTLT